MENSLSLTSWETKILQIVFQHLPNITDTESTSTVQSVLNEIQQA